MKNYRTTLIGAILAAIVAIQPYLETGEVEWKQLSLAGLIALLSYVAKDAKVSGTP